MSPTPPDPRDVVLPPPLPRAGRALAATMFAWTVVVVLLVTLAPFHFRSPGAFRLEWHASAYEFAVNAVLLMVPGFLFRAATGPNRDIFCIGPLALGVALSGAIELAQGAVPGRCVSPVDVAANSGGCWFGAMAYDALRRHLDPRLAGRLLLELPLMGVVYLLVPLLWFSGEAAAEDGRRLALTIPLGVLGGGVLAAVWHHRLRPSGVLSPGRVALVAVVWFVAAASPGLRHRPGLLAAGTLIVGISTRQLAVWPWFLKGDGARFEVPVLRRLGGLYVLYLVVLAGWPWRGEVGVWHGEWTFPEIGTPPRIGPLFRLVEYVAAFTFGGYLIAESRGRREERTSSALLWTVPPLGLLAAGLEMLRGYAPDYGASVLRPCFAMLGAAFGAAVYRQQLAAVRDWLAARAPAVAAVPHPAGSESVLREAVRAAGVAEVVAGECDPAPGVDSPAPTAVPPAASAASAGDAASLGEESGVRDPAHATSSATGADVSPALRDEEPSNIRAA